MLKLTRKNLKTLVLSMFGALIIGFAYILFSSLGRSELSSSNQFSEIEQGQTIIRRIDGRRVWLTRLSAEQIQDAKLLETILVNPASGCRSDSTICAVAAVIANNGLELSYSKLSPPQLADDSLWFGGYVDPITGAVFDLLGRAYRLDRSSDQQVLEIIETKSAIP